MPYVFVFHYNSILPKYCNNALYSENKRYVLLKKIFWCKMETLGLGLDRMDLHGEGLHTVGMCGKGVHGVNTYV
jgi:hypothetical protein